MDRPITRHIRVLGQMLAAAAWFGLVAGLLELSVVVGQDLLTQVVTVDSIRINRHYAWMIPASDLLLFAACGLGAGMLRRLWPRMTLPLELFLLVAGALLAPILAIRGLHPLAAAALACGLATRIAPRLTRNAGLFSRVVHFSLPILVSVVGLLIVLKGGQVVRAERRALAALPAAPRNTANVLMIVLDNVRADHLSLYGYNRETTPNLARWAARGIRFDAARSTAPWTLPSHASMLTGRWPHELSTTVEHPLDATYPTLAEFMSRRGYVTGGFVANTYYCNAWYGLDRGFARYVDFYANTRISSLEVLRAAELGRRLAGLVGYINETPGEKSSRKTAAMINRDLLDWLAARGDRPFFAFLNYYDAHSPFEPPDGYSRRFGKWAHDRAYREEVLRQFSRLGNKKSPVAHNSRLAERIVAETAEIMSDSYDDCLTYLDGQLGRLLDELDRRGLMANTLVLITSDHGEHFGDHGLFGHGMSLYRPQIHVPLLVLAPALDPGIVTEPVSLRDLPATIADLTGLARPGPFPGRSLARCWGRECAPLEPLLSEVEHQRKFPPSDHVPASRGPLWSLTGRDRVYIRHRDGREELYDLAHDPAEARDLAGAPRERMAIETFRGTLDQMLRR
jgi:arylsulfatase A-like enzyme